MPDVPIELRKEHRDLLAFVDQVMHGSAEGRQRKPKQSALFRVKKKHPEKEYRHGKHYADGKPVAHRPGALACGYDILLSEAYLL